MHFNNLIMQFRLQIMGGAGAMVTIASYLIGAKVREAAVRYRLRFYVSLWLLLLIGAAAVLDLTYYNQLLRGAVKALVEFEEAHPEIKMSTRIEEVVGERGRMAPHIGYALVLIPLSVFTFVSWCNYGYESLTSKYRARHGKNDLERVDFESAHSATRVARITAMIAGIAAISALAAAAYSKVQADLATASARQLSNSIEAIHRPAPAPRAKQTPAMSGAMSPLSSSTP